MIAFEGDLCVKKALLFLTSLLMFGCDQLEISNKKNKGEEPAGADKTTRIEASTLENEIKVNIKGTDPEKYAVQFSWPYLENGKILRVRLGSVLAEVLPNQTYFTHVLPHNQTVTFSFDILDKNRKPEQTFTKTIRIPTDFVSKADSFSISKDTKIEANRVYLSHDFPLTTNGNTVDIVANEIHAERGFIQTFPKKIKILNKEKNTEEEIPPTADTEKNGRPGGNISISAKKLFGRMKVYMRGERGGQGPKGDPTDGQQSGTGKPAGNGKTICISHGNECGRRGKMCVIKPTFMPEECVCENFGPPGGKGLKGNTGKQGKQGMTGGDSGNIRISIQEYVPLEGFDPTLPQEGGQVVQVFEIPGSGGRGGPGGDGQKGSPGGAGRDTTKKDDCRGETGIEGDRGDQGPEGFAGNNGKVGLKCIYVGSENVNECTQ